MQPDNVRVLDESKYNMHVVVHVCMRWMPTVDASLAQLAEHALRKRTVVGSIPTGGSLIMTAHSMLNAPLRFVHCGIAHSVTLAIKDS